MKNWSLSWHGLATVVDLEVRQRLRSRRWLWGLLGWFVFIGGITGLVMWAVYESYSYYCDSLSGCSLGDSEAGPIAFSGITLFILGMGLVIAPAFTATAINGDRNQGTLATLQATRLSSAEIAGGKLIAAWLSVAVFLVVALPFIVVTIIFGNISILQVVVCFVVIFVLVAIVCAIGLGWSSVFTRASASTVMTYLSVITLSIISILVMGLSLAFIDDTVEVRVWGLTDTQRWKYEREMQEYWDGKTTEAPPPPINQCQWFVREQWTERVDLVWWVLVPNPFVIVADAAPLSSDEEGSYPVGLLGIVREGVREMSRPPVKERDECTTLYEWIPGYNVERQPDGTIVVYDNHGRVVEVPESPVKPQPLASQYPVWPWGLGVNFLIGAAFFVVVVRKLSIPYRTLAKGTRVA